MRKFISLKTLELAAKVVAEKIGTMSPGEDLRALYIADTELAEAITAAQQEPPEPKAPKKSRKSRRSSGASAASEPQE